MLQPGDVYGLVLAASQCIRLHSAQFSSMRRPSYQEKSERTHIGFWTMNI